MIDRHDKLINAESDYRDTRLLVNILATRNINEGLALALNHPTG
jgi:hypothetical protein